MGDDRDKKMDGDGTEIIGGVRDVEAEVILRECSMELKASFLC